MQELQVLYEVRLHENKQLNNQLQTERQEKTEMFRKMTLLDAEKERALLSRTEADKLLGKFKCKYFICLGLDKNTVQNWFGFTFYSITSQTSDLCAD